MSPTPNMLGSLLFFAKKFEPKGLPKIRLTEFAVLLPFEL